MRKLINGIVEFRQKLLPEYRDLFAHLALEQKPDTLFIACSDSRVVPNLFASTNPGDLFVIRNVGNLIPRCDENGISVSDEAEAAAIEFALGNLNVSDIIICGHSECGAMRAIQEGRANVPFPNLKSWLRHGEVTAEQLKRHKLPLNVNLAPHNILSQANVLKQLENLQTYTPVRERMEQKKLRIHGWWFDIAQASVHTYDQEKGTFCLIDEQEAARLLRTLD